MSSLQQKIDFALIFRVTRANPNGDPLNGNRPRTDYAGHGEMTDVCIKRKARDRLLDRYRLLPSDQQQGQGIFVQSDDYKIDGAKNLRTRAETVLTTDLLSNREAAVSAACKAWFDVRAFGQVFPFKGKKTNKKAKNSEEQQGGGEDTNGVSIPVRGPVTIQSAFSLERVDIEGLQIVKSTSLEGDGENRQSDQMGMKYRVDKAVYQCFGSINPQLAERTGFSDDDAEVIKSILPQLFENDASSARPDGSMQVLHVIWWKHSCKAGQHSSAKVHDSLRNILKEDGSFNHAGLREALPGLEPEIIPGF